MAVCYHTTAWCQHYILTRTRLRGGKVRRLLGFWVAGGKGPVCLRQPDHSSFLTLSFPPQMLCLRRGDVRIVVCSILDPSQLVELSCSLFKTCSRNVWSCLSIASILDILLNVFQLNYCEPDKVGVIILRVHSKEGEGLQSSRDLTSECLITRCW